MASLRWEKGLPVLLLLHETPNKTIGRAQQRSSIRFNWLLKLEKGPQMFQGTRTHSRILGCKSQMAEFRFFFDINLAYRMYSITDHLSKALQRETISSIEGQETAMKTVETFKSISNIDSADCFLKPWSKKLQTITLSVSLNFQGKENPQITNH